MQAKLNIATRAARDVEKTVLQRAKNVPPTKAGQATANEYILRVQGSIYRSIKAIINRSFPDDEIHDADSDLLKANTGTSWIIDPLCGTTNFLRRIDHHCTVVGIREGRVLQHAVVVDHMRDEVFYASKDEGAREQTDRLRISYSHSLNQSVIGIDTKDAQLSNALSGLAQDIRQSGCLGLDIAYVASERLDACCAQSVSIFYYDLARLFVAEAGGFVSSLDGGEWLTPDDGVVAANPQLNRKLVTLFRRKLTQDRIPAAN